MAAPPIIEPRLKKHDESAGMPKTFFALSMPITSAASETSRMNGYITRTIVTVSAISCGIVDPVALSPRASEVSKSTIHGAASMPASVTRLMKTAASVIILFASAQADSSPSDFSFLENVVTNACDSAPSANRSRSRLGTRKAR